MDADVASASVKWDARSRELVIEAEGVLEKRQFSVEQYAGARKARDAIVDAAETDLFAVR